VAQQTRQGVSRSPRNHGLCSGHVLFARNSPHVSRVAWYLEVAQIFALSRRRFEVLRQECRPSATFFSIKHLHFCSEPNHKCKYRKRPTRLAPAEQPTPLATDIGAVLSMSKRLSQARRLFTKYNSIDSRYLSYFEPVNVHADPEFQCISKLAVVFSQLVNRQLAEQISRRQKRREYQHCQVAMHETPAPPIASSSGRTPSTAAQATSARRPLHGRVRDMALLQLFIGS
jgi:hypothetical protein